ncbi:MAG: MaoC family dehydratase [Silicimonas sp.]|jgi:acyl dehydratase|nr:MaoC family dehydratase [Silicimonas sp.]
MTQNPLTPGTHGADAFSIGHRIDCGSRVVTAGMIDAFAALTGDRFEIHMDQAAAQRHGFADRVAHGLLVLSLIDGMKNLAPVQISARASLGWEWRFRRPVLAGDEIAMSYEIAGKESAKAADQAVLVLDFTVTNQEGTEVQTGRNRLLAYR